MKLLHGWVLSFFCLMGVVPMVMADDPLLDHSPAATATPGSEARGVLRARDQIGRAHV